MLFGFCFLPRWINNKIVRNNESIFYISVKRCAVYAFIPFVVGFICAMFPRTIGNIIGDIGEFFGEIFEFIFHLFNYIGLPEFINVFLVGILVIASIFLAIHFSCSGIVKLYKRVRKKY